MRKARALSVAGLLLAACGHPQERDPTLVALPTPDARLPDAPPASQDETLAAIQKAMNELDEALQGCWAAAATERFDIGGRLTLRVEVGAPAGTTAVAVEDTLRSSRLTTCMLGVTTSYPFAPPLYGQSFQLPFQITAPDGQSVIDRAGVSWVGQSKLAIAVLLDQANSNNKALSMFEIALEAGASTGLRKTERAELWYFLGPATISGTAVVAGDMAYVKAGGARDVVAGRTAVHAIVVATPGGKEGSARAGALPTREVGAVTSGLAGPIVLAQPFKAYPRASGTVAVVADATSINDLALSASVLVLPAGTNIPEHTHGGETEALYILEGAGTMTVGGVALPFGPTSVIQVPPNVPHSVMLTADFRALQIYTPAGPEQRFKVK